VPPDFLVFVIYSTFSFFSTP
jgi:hypothetical protein